MSFSIEEAAREHPTRAALVVGEREYTFSDLAREARRKAGELEMGRASPTPIVARVDAETLFSIYAMLEAHAPFLPTHPRLTETERVNLVQNARISAENAGKFADRALAVLFTSGTRGTPRGAVLSRKAFEASARASAANLPWKENDRWLLCMPLSHVGGLSVVTRSLAARTCVVVHEQFDVGRTLTSIVRDRVTRISVVPTMLFDLLAADRDNVLAELDTVLVGGAATSSSLLEECARRRVRALTTYGLTEACSQVTTQAPRDPREVRGGSGHPLPGLELTIVDEHGRPLKPGEMGSISIRGPQLMDGYLGEARLDGRAFDTGDLGVLDDRGELFVASRRSDLIVSGGENVYPTEVENVLASCPGVTSAIVFGLEHERWGQEVCAAVVPSPSFDADRVRNLLREKLAPFKIPKKLATVSAFPLKANGKIDRNEAVRAFACALRPWRSP